MPLRPRDRWHTALLVAHLAAPGIAAPEQVEKRHVEEHLAASGRVPPTARHGFVDRL